jgi:hypothetical protein
MAAVTTAALIVPGRDRRRGAKGTGIRIDWRESS